MRICIDFTSAIADRTGVGTYTRELVRGLLLLSREPLRLAVHAFQHPGWHGKLNRLLSDAPRRFTTRASRLWPHGAVLEADLWTGLPPGEALFGACDVYHGTNFLAPRFLLAKTVVTVHDLAFLRIREEAPVAHRYERYLARSLCRADRIIAVSEATRRDLTGFLEIPPEIVEVVHEGAPKSAPTMAPVEFRAFKERHRIPERYFLHVGTLEPRKNLVRLLEAATSVAKLKRNAPGVVLAGRPGWHDGRILEAIAEARRTLPVITPGFVTEEEKYALYRDAVAFAYPSLYEGFGLPLLEAFTAGTPVVTACESALPEVAGDAALLVDPRDTEALVDALLRLATEEDLRRELVEKGRERLTRFSWRRAARETMQVYERAVGSAAP